MAECMLTTIDNPHDPYTHFKEWLAYDMQCGYYTAAFLARVTNTSDALAPADQEAAVEDAIDEIVRENVLGIYKKVYKPSDYVPEQTSTSS